MVVVAIWVCTTFLCVTVYQAANAVATECGITSQKNPQLVVMVPFARLPVISLEYPGMLCRWCLLRSWCMPQYVTRFVHRCGKRCSRESRWSTLPGRAWVGIRMEYKNTSQANKTQEERQTEARASRQSVRVNAEAEHLLQTHRGVFEPSGTRLVSKQACNCVKCQSHAGAQRHARLPLTRCRQSRRFFLWRDIVGEEHHICQRRALYVFTGVFLRCKSKETVLRYCSLEEHRRCRAPLLSTQSVVCVHGSFLRCESRKTVQRYRLLEEHCRCRAPLLSTQGVGSVHSEF